MEFGVWANTGRQRVRVRPPAGGTPDPLEQFPSRWLHVTPPLDRRSGYTLELDTDKPEMSEEFWRQAADRAAAVYLPSERFWRDTVIGYLARTKSEFLNALLGDLTLDPGTPEAYKSFREAFLKTISEFKRLAPSNPAYDPPLSELAQALGQASIADDGAGRGENTEGAGPRPEEAAAAAARRLHSILTSEPTPEDDRTFRAGFLHLREFDWPGLQRWAKFRLNEPNLAEVVGLRVAICPDRSPPGCGFSAIDGPSSWSPTSRDYDRKYYGDLAAVAGERGRWVFTVPRHALREHPERLISASARIRLVLQELNRALHRCREHRPSDRPVRCEVREVLIARGPDWGWGDAQRIQRSLSGDRGLLPAPLRPGSAHPRVQVCEDPLIAAATYLFPRVVGDAEAPRRFGVVDLGRERCAAGWFEGSSDLVAHLSTDLLPVGVKTLVSRARSLVLSEVCRLTSLDDCSAPEQVRRWTARTTARVLRLGEAGFSFTGLLGTLPTRGTEANHFGGIPSIPLAAPDLPDPGVQRTGPEADRLQALRGGYQPHRRANRATPPPGGMLRARDLFDALQLLDREEGGPLTMGGWVGGLVPRTFTGGERLYLIGAARSQSALFGLFETLTIDASVPWAAELGLLDDRRTAEDSFRNRLWVAGEAADGQRRPELLSTDWPAIREIPAAHARQARVPFGEDSLQLARGKILEFRALLFDSREQRADEFRKRFQNPLAPEARPDRSDRETPDAHDWLVNTADLKLLREGCAAGWIPYFDYTFDDRRWVEFGATACPATDGAVGWRVCRVKPDEGAAFPLKVRFAVPWPGFLVPLPLGQDESSPTPEQLLSQIEVHWLGPILGQGESL